MKTAKAYAAASPTSPLAPATIARRDPGANDVAIEILFCGVCHSDLHQAPQRVVRAPCPPLTPVRPAMKSSAASLRSARPSPRTRSAHSSVSAASSHSDGTCPACKRNMEQFCPNGVFTYNSPDKNGTAPVTYGGYSDSVVVNERFVLRVPENLNPAAAAPLLCAGITTYSPLKHWNVGPGKKVGIVGIGGLGHMGVKFSHALGAHTVVFTTSESKVADAKRLGADEVILSKNPEEVAKHAGTFDFILDTVSADHDIHPYLHLLGPDGTLCLVGVPENPLTVSPLGVIFGRKSISGSLIGGIKETQEMLDFCGEHNIVSDVEIIPIDKINEAFDRLLKSDVKYRFSIDMASLKAA